MSLTNFSLVFRPLNANALSPDPSPSSLSLSHTHTLTLLTIAIANEAEKYKELLVPDEGAEYDQLIEINLDEVSI